jgi:hypothetical protein
MKLPKEIWMCENEQARWFEFEQPYDLPNDVTVTKIVPAQPEQEPVAWMKASETEWFFSFFEGDGYVPLYTTPPQRTWVELSAEEIASIPLDAHTLQTVEKLLKEKNK